MKYLPFVVNEIGASIANSIGDNDIENITKELKHIKKVNPAVEQFIRKWSKEALDKDARLHSIFCGIMVYKLLESQAEADYMNQEFKLE